MPSALYTFYARVHHATIYSRRLEDALDQYGRPKKQIVPLPTDALPDNIDTSKLPEIEMDEEGSIKVAKPITGLPILGGKGQQQGAGKQ